MLITGDGSEVRWRGQLDQIWNRRMQEHWRKSGVEKHVRTLMEPHDAGLIKDLNHRENSPVLGGERRFAITIKGNIEADALVKHLRARLGAACNIYRIPISSSESVQGNMVCALPGICHKGKAAQYVASCLGIMKWGGVHAHGDDLGEWGGEPDTVGDWDDGVVAAGDTLGDIPMLWTGIRFIAPSNSTEDLLARIREAGNPEIYYLAKGANAFGVTEGIEHFSAHRSLPRTKSTSK